MNTYGLIVDRAPPNEGMAMLVDVVQTPTNLDSPEGRYLFPDLTNEQKERFYHYFSAVDSAIMYGKTALQTGGAGEVLVVMVFPIFTQDVIDKAKNDRSYIIKDHLDELLKNHKVIGFSWRTKEIRYFDAVNSCQAVMVWRGVK